MVTQTVYPYGTGGTLPSGIGLVNDLETGGSSNALTAEQGKILGKFLFGKVIDVSLSGITTSSYSVGDSTWGGQKGSHKVISVEPGERYTIDVTSSGSNGGWYAFFTSSYTVPSSTSDVVPYVSGTTRVWKGVNNPAEITIPSGCAYLCICPVDGNGKSATWTLTKNYNDYENTFMDKIAEIDELREGLYTYTLSQIDTSSATIQSCSLGTTQWYSSNKNPKHIAIPVTPSNVIQLQCDSSYGFYTFVTSSYSPPVTNGAQIPFANGYSERKTLESSSGAISLTVPSDAAYLILTLVDGGGTAVAWRVWDKTVLTLDEAFREYCVHVGESSSAGGGNTRIKVATWNVGGFSLGLSGESSITPSNLEEMKSKWRMALNSLGADILCCCEYDTNFMEAQGNSSAVNARDEIFTDDLFHDAKIGPEISNTYMQTAIFSNLPLSGSQVVYFNQSVVSGRYYQVVNTTIGGKPVKVVSAHLDFSNGSSDTTSQAARQAQMTQLINAFADDDYVIICGDFNVNHLVFASDYDLFTSAGYKMINHGYLGNIYTYPAGSSDGGILDNIIFKGFAFSKVDVLDDATLSDHKCLFADLTLVPVDE